MSNFVRPAASLVALAAAALLEPCAFAQERVSAAPNNDNSTISSFDPAFFSAFKPNTAMDMIQRLPGFSFEGGSSARGFAGTAGNVLIDGERPPSRGDSLSAILSRIPAISVARIDIVRGSGGGIDMQGRPVVANVVRKKDTGLTGAARGDALVTDLGAWSEVASLETQYQRDNGTFEGSISATTNSNVNKELRVRSSLATDTLLLGRARSESDSDRFEAAGSTEVMLWGGRLRANAKLALQEGVSSREEILIVPGGGEVNLGESDNKTGEIGLRFTRSIGRDIGLELTAFQSSSSSEALSSFDTNTFVSAMRRRQETGESILRAGLRWHDGGDWTLEFGAETTRNWVDTDVSRSLDGAPFPLAGDVNEARELRTDLLGIITWAPLDTINFEAGARYEWFRIAAFGNAGDSQKSLDFLKPRVNLSWSPIANHQLGLRAERVVEQLSFDAFASSASFDTSVFGVGNPTIEPEKAWLLEARYERQFGGQTSFVAQYSHRRIEDFLGRAVVSVLQGDGSIRQFEITRNVGDAWRDAVKVSGSLELDRFGAPGVVANIGIEARNSRTIDPITGVARRISGQAPLSWNLGLTQVLFAGDFRWSVFAEGDAGTINYSPRSIVDSRQGVFLAANFSWRPTSDWTIGGGINNILADDGQSVEHFFDAPRDTGSVLYVEERNSLGSRRLFLSLRRTF